MLDSNDAEVIGKAYVESVERLQEAEGCHNGDSLL